MRHYEKPTIEITDIQSTQVIATSMIVGDGETTEQEAPIIHLLLLDEFDE